VFYFSVVGSAYSNSNMPQMAQELVTCSLYTVVCH